MKAKALCLEEGLALLLQSPPPGWQEGEEGGVLTVGNTLVAHPPGGEEDLAVLLAYLPSVEEREEPYRRLADA
jgi:hypothetical protein